MITARSSAHWRRRARSLLVIVAIGLAWECGKAAFSIPSYKLPHLHEIFGDFLRRGAGGELWAWIMVQNAAYTALEGLVGLVVGGGVPHVLPSLPYLFTALRLSATISVVGAIIGELPVGSRYGMGVVIINAAQYYNWRPENLWAAILVSALLGIAFYHAVAAVERRTLTWQPTAPAI